MLFSRQILQSTRRLSLNIPLRSITTAQKANGRIGKNFYVTELKKRIPDLGLWGLSLGFLMFWPFAFSIYNRKNYAVGSY